VTKQDARKLLPWLATALGLAIALLIYFGIKSAARPAHGKLTLSPTVPPGLTVLQYDFMAPDPFIQGHAWVFARDAAGGLHYYYVDMDTGVPVAEGSSIAQPLVYDAAGGRLLTERRQRRGLIDRLHDEGLLEWAVDLGQLKPRTSDRIDFQIWSAGDEAPIDVGFSTERHGGGGGAQVSPRLDRYRFQTTTGDHAVIDVIDGTMTRLPPTKSWMGGWWSDDELLFIAPNGDLLLHDLSTRTSAPLFTMTQIDAFLTSHGLKLQMPDFYGLISAWDPDKDRFAFFIAENLYLTERSWLIRIDRDKRALTLLTRDFPFDRLGRINGPATLYVYTGEPAAGGPDAVHLHDIDAGASRTLVSGSPGATRFSLPAFHRDRVVYMTGGASEPSGWTEPTTDNSSPRPPPPNPDTIRLNPRDPYADSPMCGHPARIVLVPDVNPSYASRSSSGLVA
jgi:hypothetical protein